MNIEKVGFGINNSPGHKRIVSFRVGESRLRANPEQQHQQY